MTEMARKGQPLQTVTEGRKATMEMARKGDSRETSAPDIQSQEVDLFH